MLQTCAHLQAANAACTESVCGISAAPQGFRDACAQADAVFLSPPWGGPSYSASTFDVSTDIGGLGVGIAELLAAATALLAPSNTSHSAVNAFARPVGRFAC